MDSKRKFIIFVLLFFIPILLGCSKQALQNVKQAKVNDNKNVYKIAAVAPQFGPYKALGLSIIRGVELAVDEKNQSGGIDGKKIELIKEDDGGLAGEGTWRARSLVEQMVLGVIGHLNSDISIPASEVYSKAMIPQISPGSTSPFFTEREPVRGYVFRTIGRDDKQGELVAKYVNDKGFKKIAVLYNNRSYGSSLATEFVKQVNIFSKATEVVFYEMYKVNQDNFNKEVETIHELSLQKKSPDFVFFVGEYSDAAKFLVELKASALNPHFLGSEGVFDPELVTIAKEASEGASVVSLPAVKDPAFIKNYKSKFGKELGAYSAASFDGANILISAIEKVKEKDPEKIAKVISDTKDYPGISGKISFDIKGDLVNPNFTVYQVKDGMFVAVQSDQTIFSNP